ncbi:MAG TPA: hypothetical protein VLV29_04320 [Steroidobacteraceae bacterium]|nr:hypothetical protein [Steroidobacteraceae bacterium]
MSASSAVRVACTGAVLSVLGIAIVHPRALAVGPAQRTIHVTGRGVDRMDGALVHSEQQTPAGLTRISTAVVELEGDLHGRVLYQVTTRIDSARRKLTNTGRQVYSGTIAGSGPVMLYDDSFVFEANLASGSEHGQVHLVRHLGSPAARCELQVSGTGKDAQGNPMFTYEGDCLIASNGVADH